MTGYPSWTPPARPGAVPLYPMSFGLLLGRSFSALRRNPRVLLGFAVVVQAVAFIVAVAVVGGLSYWAASRLQNVAPGSADYATIQAGSFAVVIIAGVVVGLCASALSIIVQAVVVTDVTRSALGERATLAALWHRVRPVAWRLIGYTLLVTAAIAVGIAIVAGIVLAAGTVSPVAAVALTVLAALAGVVVLVWLATKLVLVAPTIIVEHATIGGAIGRSWRLTRRRFWPVLGVVVLIQVIFSAVSEAVVIPFALAGSIIGAIIAPTGDPGSLSAVTVIVALVVPEVIGLLIQSVGSVVQSSAAALLYIDCRMRHEGLHLDMLGYVQRRDAGATDLPDPYLQGIGRGGPSTAGPSMPPPAYAAPGYPPPVGRPTAGAPPVAAPPAAARPPAWPPTAWTAPGSGTGGPSR